MFPRLVLLIICCFPITLLAQSEEDLQKLYTQFLENRGYETSIDSDGDVAFVIDGRNYFIETSESELQYFRIGYPNFWRIESEKERIEATEAANTATKSIKVVKVFVVNDNVWASTEILLAGHRDFALVFDRCFELLRAGVDRYVEEMQ